MNAEKALAESEGGVPAPAAAAAGALDGPVLSVQEAKRPAAWGEAPRPTTPRTGSSASRQAEHRDFRFKGSLAGVPNRR